MNREMIRDDEGESLGSVENYIERFKRMGSGDDHFTPQPSLYSVSRSRNLPEKWNKKSEQEILAHYYMKFGDTTFEDFEDIAGKIATNVNRLYSQKLTPDEVYKKLLQIPKKEFKEKEEKAVWSKRSEVPVAKDDFSKIKIKEMKYAYKRGLKRVSFDLLELCQFISNDKICFSSDDAGFFLTVKDAEKSFDKLFNFSAKEQLVYEMFKDQLGDENKARKLVLMSRILNEPEKAAPKKKRPGRPRKVSSFTPRCSG